MKYILRRFVFYVIAAWASVSLNFFLPRLMPGDPGTALMARMQGQLRPETIEAMRKAYGLSNDPLLVQYFDYLRNLLRGEFGVSTSWFPAPVTQVIMTGLWWTVLLMGTIILLSFLIGSVLGAIGAWRRGSFLDNVMPPFLTLLGSMPHFWVALLALYFIGFQWGLLPLRHAYNDMLSPALSFQFVGSVLKHMVLPAGVSILLALGGSMLGMRNTMIAVLAEDYVTMAEAKGLPGSRVLFRYAARNALLPVITSLGMSIGFMLGGNLFVEMIFAYPGIGYLLYNAVRALDYPLMQGLFLLTTMLMLVSNFIVDILYVRLDPRIRDS